MLVDALISMYKKITEIVCSIFLIIGLLGGFMLCGNLTGGEESFSFLAGFIGAIIGFFIALALEIAIVPPMMILMKIDHTLDTFDIPKKVDPNAGKEVFQKHVERPYQYYSDQIEADSEDIKICPKCGAKNKKANTVCTECGTYL